MSRLTTSIQESERVRDSAADIAMASALGDSTSSSGRLRDLARALAARARLNKEAGVLVAWIAIVAVVATQEPRFLSAASLANVASGASYYGILAVGLVFLLAMREIDLSVGAIYAVSALVAAMAVEAGLSPWLAAVAAIGTGACLGGVNAVLANVLNLPAIIITLGTMSVFRGLTLVLSGGLAIGIRSEDPFFSILSQRVGVLPMSAIALVVIAAVLTVVFNRARFGYLVRSVGSNERAAKLSGVRIKRVRLQAMMLTGGLCGIAGVLTFAFFRGAQPSIGTGYELFAIAAAVIGGTGLAGGSGSIPGAVIGALLISTIQSALVALGISANWALFATGLLIVSAVALDALLRRGVLGRAT